ncbi:MAG: Tellurite resistance protein TerB [Parafilimonas terrae]|nr:Tellurite resistance protein TerB [Parafilimonas terrae]
MNLVADFITRVTRAVTAYAGDEALMQALVSAAANVIVADGEVASEEFATALIGARTSPIIQKGYDSLMLEEALYDAIGRARSRFGRADNLRRVEAIADRPADQREHVFLVAAEVADFDDIAAIEDAALTEIAAALMVDKERLMQLAPVRTPPR